MLIILQPIARFRHPLNQDSLDQLRECGIEHKILTVTGCSEIARARCYLAHKGVMALREESDSSNQVLWLDADMTFKPHLVRRHQNIVNEQGVPIAGIYPQRIKPALAAMGYEGHLDKEPYHGATQDYELKPVLAGMGALMLPATLFIEQYNHSPKCADPDMPRIVCNSELRLFGETSDTYTMVSEDFSYCLSFFERELGAPCKGVYSAGLNYGHVAEKVLVNR